ncbi:uncharacterized protein B0T15DRAFT_323673 [Chaetomium strumarium]|uniref:NAD(P)-binding domain-containing protein n=1 Tax=Chaetomium strumarium TaxID=1170767 RepID=A0AAJ0GKU9_9PEZI|nr:hypothetical protein B0T15DRAFT_323673 [Chaetomium strumarium]
MSSNKTILFLGATGGVGLSALRRSVAAGHTCVALCRTPAKLSALFPTTPANLHLAQGNAHDADSLARVVVPPSDPTRLVDIVVFSIGARPTLKGMDDPHVCERGMTALLSALRTCRTERNATGKPKIVVVSTTGISSAGRDVPLAMVPLYKVLLHTPHVDKKIMERLLLDSGEEWTIVRGSLYTNGPETEGLVREGMEDPVAGVLVGKPAIGYTISREDVGKWVFENCISDESGKWVRKAAMITY